METSKNIKNEGSFIGWLIDGIIKDSLKLWRRKRGEIDIRISILEEVLNLLGAIYETLLKNSWKMEVLELVP